MTNTFKVRSIPYLLMSESSKSEVRLAAKIEEPFAEAGTKPIIPKPKTFNEYFGLPEDHSINQIEGASESFKTYMSDNAKAHPQIQLAAHNVNMAQKYLSTDMFANDGFNAQIYKQTISSVKNAFNALQKIGEQHQHGYLGDMIDEAKNRYHSYLKANSKDTFLSEPNEFKIFKGSGEGSLMKGFKDDTKNLTESDRSEASANLALAGSLSPKTGTGSHHVFIKRPNGKMKSIAGPFRSKEEAEAHPSRKWGDGVGAGHLMENVTDDQALLDESRVYTTSKTFYNKRAGKYMKRKVPVKGSVEGNIDDQGDK
jgi:hypothetical protein